MKTDLMIGILGMVFLLVAFALNIIKRLNQDSVTYIGLNILGGGLSTYYAIALAAVPFVILESIWTLVALYKLVIERKK
jgi:hypothetical protein